jgi:hypothetical protein
MRIAAEAAETRSVSNFRSASHLCYNDKDGVSERFKMRTPALCCFALLVTSQISRAFEPNASEYADKYFVEWSSQTGLSDCGPSFETGEFFHEVRPSIRQSVLHQILQHCLALPHTNSNWFATCSALECVGFYFTDSPDAPLDPGLNADLVAFSKITNSTIQRLVIDAIVRFGVRNDEAILVSALYDTSDNIRVNALLALGKCPDWRLILAPYIIAYQSDPRYSASVQLAQSAIDHPSAPIEIAPPELVPAPK